MIERELLKTLLAWQNNPLKKPILLRGARQVGKTSLIDHFGQHYFNHFFKINLELEPEFHRCFNSLKPKEICEAISIMTHRPITPSETLLFLDEIQECPKAIQALRYFKEQLPELHVIGAGSLLELALNEADYRMPVGRISSLYLKPLSFKEFLNTTNSKAYEAINQATFTKPLPESIHNYLLKQLKLYFSLGGMPEAVTHYLTDNNLFNIQPIQSDILSTYEKDFGHYAKHTQVALLRRCFLQAPNLLGTQIKYNKIDPDIRARELKIAIEKLTQAHLIQPIIASSAAGIPLSATQNEKKFKLNFVDIGLVTYACGIGPSLITEQDMTLINQGALAEQFVGQELVAYAPEYEKPQLFFWARDGHATAEVDFLYTFKQHILPIEVKSSKIGRLKSLQQFIKDRQPPFGIRFSQLPLQKEKNVLSIPLYMTSELNRLLEKELA